MVLLWVAAHPLLLLMVLVLGLPWHYEVTMRVVELLRVVKTIQVLLGRGKLAPLVGDVFVAVQRRCLKLYSVVRLVRILHGWWEDLTWLYNKRLVCLSLRLWELHLHLVFKLIVILDRIAVIPFACQISHLEQKARTRVLLIRCLLSWRILFKLLILLVLWRTQMRRRCLSWTKLSSFRHDPRNPRYVWLFSLCGSELASSISRKMFKFTINCRCKSACWWLSDL